MTKELSSAQCNEVLRNLYIDQSPASKRKYGNPPAVCVGASFDTLRSDIEREEIVRKAYHPDGCGHRVVIGWAGKSKARCGATLNSFGKQSIIKCEHCGGNGALVWREE